MLTTGWKIATITIPIRRRRYKKVMVSPLIRSTRRGHGKLDRSVGSHGEPEDAVRRRFYVATAFRDSKAVG
jgi:hypothetical protein